MSVTANMPWKPSLQRMTGRRLTARKCSTSIRHRNALGRHISGSPGVARRGGLTPSQMLSRITWRRWSMKENRWQTLPIASMHISCRRSARLKSRRSPSDKSSGGSRSCPRHRRAFVPLGMRKVSAIASFPMTRRLFVAAAPLQTERSRCLRRHSIAHGVMTKRL